MPWAAVSALVASTAFGARPASAGIVDAVLRASRTAAYGPASPALQDARPQAPRRFDIPPAPLADVIGAFERAAGVTLTLSLESLGSIQSPGVSGTFTIDEALRRLLAGTSVRVRFTSATNAVLEVDVPAEAVSVRGEVVPVVESPKYLVPLRDVPQTIEVIPGAAMEQQGVTTLSEALRNVPGITLQAGEGGGASNTAGDMFNMRGFNAANSLFVDGVRDDGLISRDVFNLEQVEVFLGPTGSDVGRGTAAGYVNLQTKVPHAGRATSVGLTVGSADERRGTADINVPLSSTSDSWVSRSAFRLNALWQDSGVPGRDLVRLGSKGIAPSLALGLGTETRVTIAAQFMDQDNVPDYGVPGAAWLEEPLTPTTVRAPRPVDERTYYGSIDYDYDRGSQASGTLRVEHDVTQRMTLRNQTRYNRAHREAVITSIQNVAAYNPATDLVTLSRQGNDRENTILSNQTSLTNRFATGRLQHAASAGVEYTSEAQDAPTLIGLGTRNPVNIFSPNPNEPLAGFAVSRGVAVSEGSTDTVAVYGFDTIDLGRRGQVSGGLRWEYYDTSFRAVDATGLTTADERASDALVSGKAGVVFRVNERANVYGSYSTSATPPGTANFTLSAKVNNQNNPSVKPQRSTNYEAGAKWDAAGGRLSLSGAVFHTVNRNVIFTVDATAIPPIYNQDDGQRVDGVTVGAAGRVLPQWQVFANFSYLDTAQESQNPLNNGRRLTLTPDWSGSVWTTYQLPRRLTVGGGIRMTDRVFVNAGNTIASPGFHLIDGLVQYDVNTHLTLRLNLYNLANQHYIRNVNNNGGRYNPGQPRSAQLTSTIAF